MRRAPVPAGQAVLSPRPSLDDVEFLFGVARRLARQAAADIGTHEGATGAAAAATGTVDALLWVLGATDVAPSRVPRGDALVDGLRPDDVLDVELVALENMRAVLSDGGPGEHVLHGAADAVCFARGWDVPFWWAPLPPALRQAPGRDEIGRRRA